MIRMIGACCILTGCGSFGFAMAAASRREEQQLRILLKSLEFMSCELSYRLTPLPGLCRSAAEGERGIVPAFFLELAGALERQTAPDVQVCVYELLTKLEPPKELRRLLSELGATLGRFDLPGQLRGLESAIRSTEEALRRIRDGAAERRRSYETLGLCAGAAMAILFL